VTGGTTIYWIGTEDDEERELLKACNARCKQWGDEDCPRPDHYCTECEYDKAIALRTLDPKIIALIKSEEQEY
jgi:hypothetical protein